ncbi:hypothetical protein OF868_03710 [Escherichia coli]|nr:hypothetical protein OF868_03710 [Escherichia coli]
MNRVLCVVIIALLVACGALSLGLNHYRDNAITYKAQRDKKPESWSRQTQPLLICRCASAMLLRSMQNTRGN